LTYIGIANKKHALKLIDTKNFIFYPLIIAAIGVTVYNLLQISGHVDFLKEKFPSCTMTNKNREVIFFTTMIVLAFVQKPIEKFSKQYFIHAIPTRKFPIGS